MDRKLIASMARRASRLLAWPGLIVLCGCVFDNARRTTTDVGMVAASAYVFRGQIMNDSPVLQASTAVGLPAKSGGTTTVFAWGNLDLDDDVGNAWFDSGHAGEFTEIDLTARHTESFGGVDVTAGLTYYSWANGEMFRFAPFPSTSEVFARIGGEVIGLRPAVTLHYDIDEVEGLYVRGDVGRPFQLGRGVSLDVLAWLGWSDEDHSLWLYRTASSGFADVGLQARIVFDLDEVTTLHVGVAGSTILDDELRNWFHTRVGADNGWVELGLAWRF
ncbi:MAG TPA: hypothetical protein VF384_05065 [Planctomycetota bacterium]